MSTPTPLQEKDYWKMRWPNIELRYWKVARFNSEIAADVECETANHATGTAQFKAIGVLRDRATSGSAKICHALDDDTFGRRPPRSVSMRTVGECCAYHADRDSEA